MTVEIRCPFCRFSKSVPRARIPEGVRRATCPRCGQRFPFSLEDTGEMPDPENRAAPGASAGEETTEEKTRRSGSPWENRSRLGLWQGIYQTFRSVLFSPAAFFSTLELHGGIREPLAFGILSGSLGTMSGLFWQFLIFSAVLFTFSGPLLGRIGVHLVFLMVLVSIPVFAALSLFISSGILHPALRLVGSGKNGFEATFRVVSYSHAAGIWSVIPFVGGGMAGVWQLVVQVIGLREAHETTYPRVIAAYLIPAVLVLCCFVAGLIFLFSFGNGMRLDRLMPPRF